MLRAGGGAFLRQVFANLAQPRLVAVIGASDARMDNAASEVIPTVLAEHLRHVYGVD